MHADDPTPGAPVRPGADRPAPGPQPRTTPPTAPTVTPPTGSPGAAPGAVAVPTQQWQAPPDWAARDTAAMSRPATQQLPPVVPPSGPPRGPVGGAPLGAGGQGPGGAGPGVPGPARVERTGRGGGGGVKAALIGGLVGAIVAGGVTAAAMSVRDGGSAPAVAAQAVVPDRGSNAITGEALDIRALLQKVQPSVVSIHTGTREGEAAGSGIVLTEDGLVLTNAHVIEGADRIEVDFHDGQSVEARLVGAAPEADVALVKVSGLDGPAVPAELGSSDALLVGDEVVAIGNALNLGAEPSVTTGIVSQVGRSISAPDGSVLSDLIQTDAAINPGNSGGPLVNAQGQVVGVNTAILADAQNIGFALEIDSIRQLIEDIQSGKDATKERPVLGVATVDVARIDQDLVDRFGVSATSGAFIQEVTRDSGADVAGLQAGDVILEVDGRKVRSADDVGQAVRARSAGESVTIVVEREGEELSVTATLGSG
jgi:S1-C subfamily serine protease